LEQKSLLSSLELCGVERLVHQLAAHRNVISPNGTALRPVSYMERNWVARGEATIEWSAKPGSLGSTAELRAFAFQATRPTPTVEQRSVRRPPSTLVSATRLKQGTYSHDRVQGKREVTVSKDFCSVGRGPLRGLEWWRVVSSHGIETGNGEDMTGGKPSGLARCVDELPSPEIRNSL
jgi:hypothetical protein